MMLDEWTFAAGTDFTQHSEKNKDQSDTYLNAQYNFNPLVYTFAEVGLTTLEASEDKSEQKFEIGFGVAF